MAGGKLEVQIGADITDFEKKIKEVEFDIKELSKVKLEKLKVGLDTKEINAQIKDAKNELNSLRTTVRDTGTAVGGQFTKQVGNGSNALMQFSRIAQDAPYGIMGIGNNITASAEAFGYLKQQTGSTGGALKAMASSIMGTGGILLGVSLLTTGLTLLSQSGLSVGDVFNKLIGNTDAYADALKKVNNEAYNDKGVQQVVSNVNQLTNEIQLAKEGFIDKNKVVEHYNETMGKTTGIVKKLDEVEQKLVKNGDAYIKMTLYKAAATLALNEAAKKQLEVEKTKNKKLSEYSNAFLDADLTQTRSQEQFDAKQANLQRQLKKRKQEELNINQNAANANLAIAKKFQEDAAKIAKDFKFNFFEDNKVIKENKTKEVKVKIVAQAPDFENIEEELSKAQRLLDARNLEINIKTISETEAITGDNPSPEVAPLNFNYIDGVKPQLDLMIVALQEFNTQANDLIVNSIGATFANLGTSIGEALATGGNVLNAIGQTLLQGLANFLSGMGDLLIKYGTLAIIKGKLDLAIATGGPVSIGAGLAAIAVGVALKAVSGAIGSFASSGGARGASSSTGAGSRNESFTSSGFSSNTNNGGTVVFEIAGQKLIGVLSNTLNANRRLGGQLGL